ncbi:MAG: hypothetical protein KDA60_14480, partial [Planctomycetales bacterium]|nr:hypothetical protein [Planctomycetales bacterium]
MPVEDRIKSVIELELRPGDERLDQESLAVMPFSQRLKRPPSVSKFPGALVLRRFAANSTICVQGDAGNTAFYILTTEDLLALRQFQQTRLQQGATAATTRAKDKRPTKLASLNAEIDACHQRLEQLTTGSAGEPNPARRAATARLAVATRTARGGRGVVARILSRISGTRAASRRYIPIDAPTDIDYDKREAPLHEGDLFGEMSCMTFAPRSATITTDRDCYMLEFNRHIFDAMQRDAGYQQWMGDVYRRRALSTHLSQSDLFGELRAEHRARLIEHASLATLEPGAVICDEGDPSDSVYIIRNGLVQVVKQAHLALRPADISDWQRFCRAIVDAGTESQEEIPPPSPATQPEKPSPPKSPTAEKVSSAGKAVAD